MIETMTASADKGQKIQPRKEDLYKTARIIETGKCVALSGHSEGFFRVDGRWIAESKLEDFCL